jgi:hypothetical protein
MHNRLVIRRLALLPASLALLQAFFMAPYQHVHLGTGHEGHGDHGESTVVHAHPYAISVPISGDSRPEVEHAHKAHASVSLDTFATLPQTALFLFCHPELPVRIVVPVESTVWVEIIEACGHDPPCFENTIPRAPPI